VKHVHQYSQPNKNNQETDDKHKITQHNNNNNNQISVAPYGRFSGGGVGGHGKLVRTRSKET